ncbi:MAG: tRNA lysidine(34) synthetase TilS [Microthrixaceae bacterium]
MPDPTGQLEVAVSGGPDSVALLALAVATGIAVKAHHVDHGLRNASASEAGFVSSLCEHWGAAFQSHRVVVPDGADLERRCRDARIGLLPTSCLTGHTADDQAETVLMRLMRGTGPAGLAAMDPEKHPMLGIRRAETQGLCELLGVRPVDDPMNHSERFTRNRVRSEILPLMNDVAGRDVVPLLARTAELAAENAEVLMLMVDEVDPSNAASVAGAPSVVATEALRRFWRQETGGLMPPDRGAVERMVAVARGERRSAQVAQGWTLRRRTGRLWLERAVPRAGSER